jgi:ElaB/YqjD/DUF883 family membrane-anchored ribosome-binding protein
MVSPGSESTTEQVARLREQVEALMRDRITPAVANAAGRAEDAVHRAAGAVRDQAESASRTVRSHPLPAVLIAAAIGFVLGRVSP